jgi:hypothetical protein
MSDKQKPNYFGSVFYNEYEGQFSGYALLLSLSQLEDAKQFVGESGRVRINIRNGKIDPKKPYATIAPDNSKGGGQAQQSKQYNNRPAQQNEGTSDLPF